MASGRGTSLSFCQSSLRRFTQQGRGADSSLASLADPFHSHYILLLTWVLAIIGWFVAFIAMCVGEAAVSNTSPTFGSLVRPSLPLVPASSSLAQLFSSFFLLFVRQWFNIFLQLAVMIGFFIAIATDSLPLYQLQLSIFGAVALVFAVDGVRPSLSPLFCSFSFVPAP